MPIATNASQKLNAQWYNAMAIGLQLNTNQFQLLQGPATIPKNTADVWAMFNVVPPTAFSNFYSPNPINNFTSIYKLILSSLVIGSDSDFQNCMADYYEQWINYFNAHAPSPFNADTASPIFTKWAMMFAPGQAGCAYALIKAMLIPTLYANKLFDAANGSYAWNKSIDGLQMELNSGPSKSFTFNTATQSDDVSHVWSSNSAPDVFNFFSISDDSSYDDLSAKIISSTLDIAVSYQKVTTFSAEPYQPTNYSDPALYAYRQWYASSVLSLAYANKDNSVWNASKPVTWDRAFGPNGILQRITKALVVADGIYITITSSASFNADEQAKISTAAAGGTWPLFSPDSIGGKDTRVTFDGDGKMTCTVISPLGNPQVLGVLQSPISNLF